MLGTAFDLTYHGLVTVLPVRLTEAEYLAIIQAIQGVLPPGELLSIRLFGSRTDLSAKGGDIDLWIELAEAPKQKLSLIHRLRIALEDRLEERKMDLHLSGPIQSLSQPEEIAFYQIVQSRMVTLWSITQPSSC